MNNTNIYIAYNEKLVCDGLSSLIYAHGGYTIIGVAVNGEDLFNSIEGLNIDILIIELGYPTKCNLHYLTKIKSTFPNLKLLLITSFFKQGLINKFIDLGVDAYILKKCGDRDLYAALDKLRNDETFFCSFVTQLLLAELHDAHKKKNEFLTSREIEIMKFLIEGVSNKSVAKKMNISLHTVKTHRKNIMDKFGSKNMISMIRYACRENLIDHDNGAFCLSCAHKLATNS